MAFNSFDFFWFFPLVVAIYFLLPQRFRWVLLLGASYYFYMVWKAEYAILIAISTLVDYLASRQMAGITEKRKRRPWLYLSLLSNLGILLTFKYYNFFQENVNGLLDAAGVGYDLPVSELILPMGISFYTFQTMAYTIDVYNGKMKAEKHLGYFALYVTYFPQLVAGPIERAQNLLPEFRKNFTFDYERVVSGLKQMLWGFFKKLVIADNIGAIVDVVYDSPYEYSGLTVVIATVFFAFQIYCDFSGYSDIAIGASRVLGIKLMDNFRTPYFSQTISEFWSRWHISLSSWFRDYLYIPLGGNRVVKWRWYMNLLIVFLVSGFWHGANWTYIVWGALHGGYLVFAILTKNWRERLIGQEGKESRPIRWVQVLVTFILVCLAWVYFRADTVGEANYLISSMGQVDLSETLGFMAEFGLARFALLSILLLVFAVGDFYMDRVIKFKATLSRPWSLAIYALALALILIVGHFGEVNFIYFQF